MADGRRGKNSRPKKRKNRQVFASEIPRRERSKRRKLSGIVPWGRQVNFDSNASINLEIDLNKDPENPRNPSRIIPNWNGENPKANVIESNGANDDKTQGPFNATAWEHSMKKKIEPVKSGVSELSHMYYEGVLNDEAGRPQTRKSGCGGVCRFNTEDFSVVLEFKGRPIGNGRDMGSDRHRQDGQLASGVSATEQFSVPCNGIESNKDDPPRRVLVSLHDDDDEHNGDFQARVGGKRARKRAGGLRRRKQVVELDQYLDTHIIDRYMEQLWKKLPKDKKEHCTYLDCLWFSMYLEESTSFKILKWIKVKRIFSKRYVFIPIVHWGHWNLLILCHFGEDLSSEVRTPCMLLLDSLKGTDPSRLEPLIRKFLVEVHKGEGRKDSDKVISRIPLLVPEVPQQTNGNDCGVFLLHFIDLFLKRAPENFSTSEDCYPYFLTKDWFKLCEIRRRRKQINDVLLKEQDGANQMISRRISTRSKKLHGFLGNVRVSNWIDLSSAA